MRKSCYLLIGFFLGSLAVKPSLLSADNKDVAVVLKTKGDVRIKRQVQRQWTRARRGKRVDDGETVKTGANSLAALVFTDDRSQLKIRANSNVTIRGKREKEGIIKRISLGFGQLWAKVTKQKTSMRIETPSGVATVKGTTLSCLFDNTAFFVYCQEGLIEVFNQFGAMQIGANEIARLAQGPPEKLQVDPDSIFDLSDGEGQKLRIEFEDGQGNRKSLILNFN